MTLWKLSLVREDGQGYETPMNLDGSTSDLVQIRECVLALLNGSVSRGWLPSVPENLVEGSVRVSIEARGAIQEIGG